MAARIACPKRELEASSERAASAQCGYPADESVSHADTTARMRDSRTAAGWGAVPIGLVLFIAGMCADAGWVVVVGLLFVFGCVIVHATAWIGAWLSDRRPYSPNDGPEERWSWL